MLESYILNCLKKKPILLMTHIVLGYPSFEASEKIIEKMVEAGVDLMELQIPFSEPIADGPVILSANQKSLEKGTRVKQCLDFSRNISRKFDIPFLFMTYYNILFKYGIAGFVQKMVQNGISGSIVPDLPPEEGAEYLSVMKQNRLSPIFIFSPTTSDLRMTYIDKSSDGFVYCVARKGVTGEDTSFSDSMSRYLTRCREATKLPLAVGFGIRRREDIDFLIGKAEIAVVGSETIRLIDAHGTDAIGPFIKNLRADI